MKSGYTREKILIWAKTYPELSSKYLETVCTAGMLPSGKPLRLYPIPYRYLGGEKEQFSLFQWITADIQKKPDDSRPESFRIDCDSIESGEIIPTTQDEWGKRAEWMFRDPAWQFDSVEDLQPRLPIPAYSIEAQPLHVSLVIAVRVQLRLSQ